MDIIFKDCRCPEAPLTGFISAGDAERDLYLHAKVFIYSDGSISLEKFMSGSVGKYEFKCADWERDTLFFIGKGKGRKPDMAWESMQGFLEEVSKEISNKTINDYK